MFSNLFKRKSRLERSLDDCHTYDAAQTWSEEQVANGIPLEKQTEYPVSIFHVWCIDSDWFKLPKNVTEPYGLWYRLPGMYEMRDMKDWTKGTKLNNYIKNKYPIQFFLRDTLCSYFRRRHYGFDMWFYENIKCNIWPQHPELRKTIPKIWADLDSIITNFLGACITSYVEDEDALNTIGWGDSEKGEHEPQEHYDAYKEKMQPLKKEIEALYNHFKVERPRLLKELDAELMNYNRDYEVHTKKEEELQNLDTDALIRIIKIRKDLWS